MSHPKMSETTTNICYCRWRKEQLFFYKNRAPGEAFEGAFVEANQRLPHHRLPAAVLETYYTKLAIYGHRPEAGIGNTSSKRDDDVQLCTVENFKSTVLISDPSLLALLRVCKEKDREEILREFQNGGLNSLLSRLSSCVSNFSRPRYYLVF